MPRSYAMMARFAAPARPRAQIWRLGAGTVVLVAGYVLFLVIAGLLVALAAHQGFGLTQRDTAMFEREIARMETGRATMIVLFSFAAIWFSTWLAAQWVHRRGLGSLIGPWRQTRRDFLRVMLALCALNAILFPVFFGAVEITPHVPLSAWLAILPLTLLGVLIQTSAEELVFRGYLQQQLAARFAAPFVWLVIPSILFGLLHHDPDTMGGNTWAVVIWASVFGLAAGDLTARSGNLGAAAALHFVNNVGAIALVSVKGPLSGLALYHLPFFANDTEAAQGFLILDLVTIGLAWLVARVMLRR